MINILTCDDEAIFLDIIGDEIKAIMSALNEKYTYYRFNSGSELLTSIITEKAVVPNILFLDIRMPKTDGKEAALAIKAAHPDCQIIFITSHEDEIYDCFDYNVNGFISKYSLREKLPQNLQRVLANIRRAEPKSVKLTVFNGSCGYELRRIDICDIVYLECIMKKVYINTSDGECLRVKCSMWHSVMNDFERFPFAVPHQNYIVNMEHISRISSEGIGLKNNSTTIALSKHRKNDFLNRYSDFISNEKYHI